MPMNSVNTNYGAMVALQSLNATNTALEKSQKAISTGYRVSDALDDGAAYAVAQRVRGDVLATTSANQQLGGVQGLLSVTNAALTNISNTLNTLQAVVVKMADGTISDEQLSQYQTQAASLVSNIQSYIKDATYNGKNILNDPTAMTNSVVRNGQGDTYSFAGYSALACIYNLISDITSWSRVDASNALTSTGDIASAITNTVSQLNNFGSYANYIDAQITFNSAKIDAQNTGLGALVDADLAEESAKLQALQIRQQLGTQALSIANTTPQTLLRLFQ